MSKKKLEISRHNWGLKGPGSWDNMKWEIFDDLSIVRTDEYLEIETIGQASKKKKVHEYTIRQEEFDSLVDNIALAKEINVLTDGCDGEAWTFVEYNDDGSVKWMRDTGYIYGIKPLEKISNYLLAAN
ncbi:hypothetical protein IKD49_00675 [Candidatus Saccharibacteria bacterium]|nr:hypothetical protein [Candidatus Saccharibacteria bacterium]MBR2753982.1 hypothetical protein [Candidatus Saccharibacteria bacterium]